jgi:hypothetical protein
VQRCERLLDAGYEGTMWPLEKARWEREDAPGRIPIPAKHFDQIKQDMERIRDHGEVAELLTGGQAEVSMLLHRRARHSDEVTAGLSRRRTTGRTLRRSTTCAARNWNRRWPTSCGYNRCTCRPPPTATPWKRYAPAGCRCRARPPTNSAHLVVARNSPGRTEVLVYVPRKERGAQPAGARIPLLRRAGRD